MEINRPTCCGRASLLHAIRQLSPFLWMHGGRVLPWFLSSGSRHSRAFVELWGLSYNRMTLLHLQSNKWETARPAHSVGARAGVEHVIGICGSGGGGCWRFHQACVNVYLVHSFHFSITLPLSGSQVTALSTPPSGSWRGMGGLLRRGWRYLP